jgi:AcrR family transcriptional regulator
VAYRKTPRSEARKAETRRRLVDVARGIVGEGGFQDLQIASVAAAAGVATGTVYRYFPSKADLCIEVFRRVCDREVQVASEIAETNGPPGERLLDAVHAVAARAVRGRKTAYALIAEPVDPAVDAERLVYRRALAGAFQRIIEDGIAGGAFPPQNAEVTAACIVGAVMESLVSPLAPGTGALTDDGRTLLDAVQAFSLRAVGAKR